MCSFVDATGTRVKRQYVRCRGRLDGDCTEPALPLLEVVAHILTRLQPAQLQQILDRDGTDQMGMLQRQVLQLQQRCDGAKAAMDATEAELGKLAAAGDAATAVVLARQVPELERLVAQASSELQEASTKLEALTARPSLVALGEPVNEMQKAFAIGADTAAQRFAVNAAMRRLGLKLELLCQQRLVGMAIGEGEVQWQPLSSLDRPALWDGVAGWESGRDGELTIEPQLEIEDIC